MTKTLKLNTSLFFALLLISGFAIYHHLGDFAHLKNADGILTDMRSMVLWDIRFPRIGLALLTGASLAIAGNAMQGIFQNPLASPGLLGSSTGATAASVFILYYFAVPFSLLLAGGVIGALLSFFNRIFDRQKLRHHDDDSKRLSGQYVAWFSNCITAFQCGKPMGIS